VVHSGTYEARLDRLQGELLVLALISDGAVVNEVALEPDVVPASGRRVGATFTVELAAGRLVGIEHDPDG
jgi:hypothetical protein